MRKALFFLILFVDRAACAQTGGGVVTGHVVDDEGVGVWRATVTLLHDDGNTAATGLTGEDGTFTIDSIAAGKYRLLITCVGFDDYETSAGVNGRLDLGTIRLSTSSEMLDAVTVMANYSEVKQNGDIFVKVKGNPLAKGKSIIDFLRLVGGLYVTNSSISVRGRTGTLIYIDDQRISLDELRAIDPSMIDRIEVIPHADASYGVNATGGVVKIRLREQLGLLGTVSLSSEANKDGVKQTIRGLNLLYSKGKLTMRNNLSVCPTSHFVIRGSQIDRQDGQERLTETKTINEGWGVWDNFALKYSPSKLDRIDVYAGVGFTGDDNTQSSLSGASSLDVAVKGKPKNYGAGLQYKRWFGKDSLSYFHFRTEYGKSKEHHGYDYLLDGTADRADMRADMTSLSVTPLLHVHFKDYMNLNVGVDYYYLLDRHDDYGTAVIGYVPDGRYKIRSNDYGAWADYSMMIGKSFYVKAGLNYHVSDKNYYDYLDRGNDVSIREDGLYPSLTTQWIIDGSKSCFLNIGYKHYYSLPNYNYKLPTVTWQNENLYSIGNPDLTKENYDDLEIYFAFNRKWAVWYDFNYGDNMVNVLMKQDESRPGVYYTTPENTGWRMLNTLNLMYSGYLFKFWYTNTYVSGTHRRESMPGYKYDRASVSFTTYNNFTVTNNFGFTLGLSTSSKTKTLSYENEGSYSVYAGAYASLLKNKLNLNLTYGGLFYNRPKLTSRGQGWELIRKDMSHNSVISLNVTWNFNVGKSINDQNLPTAPTSSGRQIPTF